MIEPGQTVDITVQVKLEAAPGKWPGFARFKIADCITEVIPDDSKEPVATFGTAIGGVFEFKINDGNDSWRYAINPAAFWAAFRKMHEEQTGQKLPELT